MKQNYKLKLFLLSVLSLSTLSLEAQSTVFNYTGSVQYYTVPAGVTSIQIETSGGQGGSGNGGSGGLGSTMIGTFSVSPGDILDVVVGEAGAQWGNSGGGGAGSGVIFSGTPLIVAGGGGGGATNEPGFGGTITTTGGSSSGAGGTGGSGGQKGYASGDCGWAAGGGGFTGDGYGGDGVWDGGSLPGTLGGPGAGSSWLSGGAGGVNGGCSFTYPNEGAWGCGGGGAGSYGGAGGGGYSGGGGGQYVDIAGERGGAGGGSYNIGTDQVNTPANHSGNGEIIITVLCSGLDVTVSDAGVCTGDEVTLTGTSITGGTVTWDGGVTNGVAFVPPTGATTYTATSTSGSDCSFSIEITSTDVPTIGATSSTPSACEGAGIILYGTGGDSYVWDMGVTDGTPFYPSTTETYTVIGSLLGCEGPPATITIDVAAAPEVIGIVTPANVCLGETYTLTGSGTADSYDWGVGVTEGSPIPAEVAGTYIYTVIGVEDATGCADTVDVTVVVNDNPIVDATASDDIICEGEEVTFTGSGATSYAWDNGITDGVPTILNTPGVATYTVTGTDDNGCSSSDFVTVTVLDAPDISGVVTNESTAFNGAIDVTITGGSGTYYITWDHGPTTEDVSGLSAGNYTINVDDDACPVSATFTVINTVGVTNESISYSLYPNPTTNFINLNLNDAYTVTVFNSLGSVVYSATESNNSIIDLTEFENGVYIFQITTENGVVTEQVIKK